MCSFVSFHHPPVAICQATHQSLVRASSALLCTSCSFLHSTYTGVDTVMCVVSSASIDICELHLDSDREDAFSLAALSLAR